MAFEELKAKQSLMWGNGAYERLPQHYQPLLDQLLARLDPKPGDRFLDVATGTGAIALAAARAGADVTAVDLAPSLIGTPGAWPPPKASPSASRWETPRRCPSRRHPSTWWRRAWA